MRPTEDREDTSSTAVPSAPSGPDDFLFHLYRGSELLVAERVVEAKEELERALALQPQDAKGQDLLAGVYFRLGVYPRAIEIWNRLVAVYPRDATLRVNLALAQLKTGQREDALDHLRMALHVAPDHARGWGYLGVVYWRLGRYEEARDAFLRGGQATMARRMEEVLASTTVPGVPSPAVSDTLPPQADDEDRAAMRAAAEQAVREFEDEQLRLSVAPPGPSRAPGGWRVAEPGEEVVPRRRRPSRTIPAAIPPRLSSLVGQWMMDLPEGMGLLVGPSGDLFLAAKHGVLCRMDGVRAVRGEMRTTIVQRRERGKDLDLALGDLKPIVRWHGQVAAVIAPPADTTFFPLSLEDDVLYVRESMLFGFEDRVGYESGMLQGDASPIVLVQLHGTGTVVLALPRAPSAIAVSDGEEVRVSEEALVGWTGRLFPQPRARGTAPYGAGAPPLAFRGDGAVLVA